MRVTMMTIKTPFLSTTDKNRGKEGREEEGTPKHRHHRHHRHQAYWNRAWPLNRDGSGEVQPPSAATRSAFGSSHRSPERFPWSDLVSTGRVSKLSALAGRQVLEVQP